MQPRHCFKVNYALKKNTSPQLVQVYPKGGTREQNDERLNLVQSVTLPSGENLQLFLILSS